MNAIGQKIKACRRERDLTQEQLAELLGVTYQAVSKWERGSASPDLSLIAPLTRLFGITADELLGITRPETNERRTYFDELCKDAWKRDDYDASLAHAREAVAEFPDDMAYREWLCSSLYYCAFQDSAIMTETLDECIRHGLVVWEQDSTELRYRALWTVVLAYAYSGRKEQAKEYALLFPEPGTGYATRDRALTVCLEGEELLNHKQKMFSGALSDFIAALREFSDCGDRRDPRTRQAVALEKAIYDVLFPDGRPLRFSLSVRSVHWKLAEIALADGDFDTAVRELTLARRYTEEADRAMSAVGERSTAPLLDTIVHNKPGDRPEKTLLEYWLEEAPETFKQLAGREDYEALIRK